VGFTRFLRRLGDEVTRPDRDEPKANTNGPGEVSDTTKPDAMLAATNTLLAEVARVVLSTMEKD